MCNLKMMGPRLFALHHKSLKNLRYVQMLLESDCHWKSLSFFRNLVIISYENHIKFDLETVGRCRMLIKKKLNPYSQTRSSVPPKNTLMNLLFKS